MIHFRLDDGFLVSGGYRCCPANAKAGYALVYRSYEVVRLVLASLDRRVSGVVLPLIACVSVSAVPRLGMGCWGAGTRVRDVPAIMAFWAELMPKAITRPVELLSVHLRRFQKPNSLNAAVGGGRVGSGASSYQRRRREPSAGLEMGQLSANKDDANCRSGLN